LVGGGVGDCPIAALMHSSSNIVAVARFMTILFLIRYISEMPRNGCTLLAIVVAFVFQYRMKKERLSNVIIAVYRQWGGGNFTDNALSCQGASREREKSWTRRWMKQRQTTARMKGDSTGSDLISRQPKTHHRSAGESCWWAHASIVGMEKFKQSVQNKLVAWSTLFEAHVNWHWGERLFLELEYCKFRYFGRFIGVVVAGIGCLETRFGWGACCHHPQRESQEFLSR
jgi:hypothetical protein